MPRVKLTAEERTTRHAARELARYYANPEKHHIRRKEYYAANREKLLAGNRAYRAANREKILAQRRASWAGGSDIARERYAAERPARLAASRRKLTGFAQADWDAAFLSQDGLCAICRENAAQAADHNHATGQKRGLLCTSCNTGLGHFRELPGRLEAAITYVRKWNNG